MPSISNHNVVCNCTCLRAVVTQLHRSPHIKDPPQQSIIAQCSSEECAAVVCHLQMHLSEGRL